MREPAVHRHPWIGGLVACAVILALFGCRTQEPSAPGPAASNASVDRDRDDVIRAHEALVDAYERGDVDAFVAVLEPSPELLVFHPRLEERFDGIEEVRSGLPRMFARLGTSEWSDYHVLVSVHGDVAWLTSHVIVESPNLPDPFLGRGTEIYLRRPDGWKLIHGHWSSAPRS